MADDRCASPGAVLLGFLSGAALGAVAALLLAPRAGHESRDVLRGYARRAEERLRELVGEAGHQFEEAVEQGRDYLQSKRSVLREAFDAGREAMRREREQSKSEQEQA
jgi:gas vesicle protein